MCLGLGSLGTILAYTDILGTTTEITYEWCSGTPMLFGRSSHQSVLLPDGDVLVIGGMTSTGPAQSTERFDSETGSWTPGPTMNVARVGHTATLMQDGTILVAGGETGSGVTHTAELIDISAGSCILVQDMFFGRSGHSAVKLQSGDVLVTGGTDWISGSFSQAEIYRRTTHEFEPAGSMNQARLFLTLSMLEDGRVLAAGGDSQITSEIYNPQSNSWGDIAPMIDKRYCAAAAELEDGRIIMSGGLTDGSVLSSSEIYDPSVNSWSAGPMMSSPRARFGLTVVDGEVFAVGSWSTLGAESSCDSYNPETNKWTQEDQMAKARGMHGQVLLTNGSIMVMGGWDGVSHTASVELMVPRESEPPEPPTYMEPKDIIPLVLEVAPELMGESQNGFVCKLELAQREYEAGNIDRCLEVMTAFYLELQGYMHHGHMSDPNVGLLYDAYAQVVENLGGEPLPPLPYAWMCAVTCLFRM